MGRDRDGTEPVEYWDNLFFDTCDIGRGIADRREGGDVIKGDREGWFGFGVRECDNTTAGGEVAGDEPEDMIVAITGKGPWDYLLVVFSVRTLDSISKRTEDIRICNYECATD